jgi:hypothetical protein
MVLEDGKIVRYLTEYSEPVLTINQVEFDTPKALVEQKSKLRSLVEESEDKDVLLAMIK